MSSDIRQLLDPNEKVIWSGFPQRNLTVTFLDITYFLFGGVWTWNIITSVINTRQNIFEVCFLGIFISFGIFLMFGNVLVRYFFRKRIEYFITDKRVIVINKSKNSVITEAALESMKHMSKRIRGTGIGTIEFGNKPYAQQIYGESLVYSTPFSKRWFNKLWEWDVYFWGTDKWIPVFYDIADVEYVYTQVNELRKPI